MKLEMLCSIYVYIHVGKDSEEKAVVELFSEYVLRGAKDAPLQPSLEQPFVESYNKFEMN